MRLSLKDDVDSLSHFKANFKEVMKKVKDTRRPMIITQNGRSAGVFMDVETWELHIRKLNVLRLINEGEVSLRKDASYSLDEVKKYFHKKYGA